MRTDWDALYDKTLYWAVNRTSVQQVPNHPLQRGHSLGHNGERHFLLWFPQWLLFRPSLTQGESQGITDSESSATDRRYVLKRFLLMRISKRESRSDVSIGCNNGSLTEVVSFHKGDPIYSESTQNWIVSITLRNIFYIYYKQRAVDAQGELLLSDPSYFFQIS